MLRGVKSMLHVIRQKKLLVTCYKVYMIDLGYLCSSFKLVDFSSFEYVG